MKIKILGAAAGGGLPQWNCTCPNCSALRHKRPHIQSRTQSQLAVTADEDAWFLINASPDLRAQLNNNPEVHPDPAKGLRNTPVAGIILTSADLDHVLGLLLMREFTPVRIYATPPVLSILRENSFFQMLDRLPGQSRWTVIEPSVSFYAGNGLTCTPIALSNSLPSYVGVEERSSLDSTGATIGLILEDAKGARVAYLPALSSGILSLKQLLNCSTILVDGTFWSDDELQIISREHLWRAPWAIYPLVVPMAHSQAFGTSTVSAKFTCTSTTQTRSCRNRVRSVAPYKTQAGKWHGTD